jgi:hypothetical protein
MQAQTHFSAPLYQSHAAVSFASPRFPAGYGSQRQILGGAPAAADCATLQPLQSQRPAVQPPQITDQRSLCIQNPSQPFVSNMLQTMLPKLQHS